MKTFPDEIATGTVAYIEEYIGDDYHAMQVRYTDVVPNESVEFETTHPVRRFFYPKSTFAFEPVGDGTRFVAENEFQVGPLASRSSHVRQSFAEVERHVREAGEHLKERLERDGVGSETVGEVGESASGLREDPNGRAVELTDRGTPEGTEGETTGGDDAVVRGR